MLLPFTSNSLSTIFISSEFNGIPTIYYNCIGSIEIPENVPLEIPEITMRTRKGVTVTYQPNPLVAAAM